MKDVSSIIILIGCSLFLGVKSSSDPLLSVDNKYDEVFRIMKNGTYYDQREENGKIVYIGKHSQEGFNVISTEQYQQETGASKKESLIEELKDINEKLKPKKIILVQGRQNEYTEKRKLDDFDTIKCPGIIGYVTLDFNKPAGEIVFEGNPALIKLLKVKVRDKQIEFNLKKEAYMGTNFRPNIWVDVILGMQNKPTLTFLGSTYCFFRNTKSIEELKLDLKGDIHAEGHIEHCKKLTLDANKQSSFKLEIKDGEVEVNTHEKTFKNKAQNTGNILQKQGKEITWKDLQEERRKRMEILKK